VKVDNPQPGIVYPLDSLGQPCDSKAVLKAQYFQEQEKLFNAKRSILLESYRGQFVLFEGGEVLEHDVDESVLLQKALKRMADRPYFFIRKVLDEDPVYRIVTPVSFLRIQS
jgi:hypothetical protein